MKRCPKCGFVLANEAFSQRGAGKLCSYCKECQRAYCRKHYKNYARPHNERRYVNQKRQRIRNRRRAAEFLQTHPCVDCGESDIRVLEFDHVRGDKLCDVSLLVSNGSSWRRVEEEMAKCVVRCANCHRRKTGLDLGWYKGLCAGA